MSVVNCRVIVVFFVVFIGASANAQEGRLDSELLGPISRSSSKDGVELEYELESSKNNGGRQFIFAPPIESFADNPVVAMGLASTTDAINRSMDSLMDSMFYSLMDNERRVDLGNSYWIQAGLMRDVYSTVAGSYVVMDRFSLGPNYAKEVGRWDGIPIYLGIDGVVELQQIYLRTDGQRVFEGESLTSWRRQLNAWFGILPLLSAVLPLSFNQNELYDPARQLATPVSFPLSVSTLKEMPIGSIRSYNISGGARFFVDLSERLPEEARTVLEQVVDMRPKMPISVFVRGDHQINVLRRGENIAWVGVKNTKRLGQFWSALVGQRYSFLKGSLRANLFGWNWIWAGRPIIALPLDFNYESSKNWIFDQVYEYDLRDESAGIAYESAVRGDFTPSQAFVLNTVHNPSSARVRFHFARRQTKVQKVSTLGPNAILFRDQRLSASSRADVQIDDGRGRFFILESVQDLSDRSWDIFLGEKETRIQQSLEIKVRKNDAERTIGKRSENHEQYVYEEDPYRLVVMMTVQDRNIVSSDLAYYQSRLLSAGRLEGAKLQKIDVRDHRLEADHRKSAFFTPPDGDVRNTQVTPTVLGRFGAQLIIDFPASQINKLMEQDSRRVWDAFAESFGHDKSFLFAAAAENTLLINLWRGLSLLLAPVRILNVRYPIIDAAYEAQRCIGLLSEMRKKKSDPASFQEAFDHLLDTAYPDLLIRALLGLVDVDLVARRIVFSAQPKGRYDSDARAAFESLNQKVLHSGPPLTPPSRYAKSKEKLASFYLDRPRPVENLPQIERIELFATSVSPKGGNDALSWGTWAWLWGADSAQSPFSRQVVLRLKISSPGEVRAMKVFVQVNQKSQVNIGFSELIQKVITLEPMEVEHGERNRGTYELHLTGPLVETGGGLLRQALAEGGLFNVAVSPSDDGSGWGEERRFEFQMVDGHVVAPAA